MTTTNQNYTLRVQHTVPHEVLENIIICAVEGGSNYWAEFTEYDPTDGQVSVRVRDREEPSTTVHLIKPKAIMHGLQILMEEMPNSIAAKNVLMEITGDYGHVDADDADAILQLSVFGEVIYG